ncbi:CBS domain-containing protein [Candidatus Bathyarchaeota archaeon]|nr:CBS domain-containing protein [Candidatus Bathyarchaeota archaeon]
MKVHEAMTKNPVTVKPNSSVQDVAKIMSEKKIGSIIISGNGELSGILTERDLVRKVLARGKDPKSVKVNEIMSKPVVRINENSDLLDASELMKKKNIRRLVVVDKTKKIVGILSTNDMARVMRRAVEELTTTYYLMSRER